MPKTLEQLFESEEYQVFLEENDQILETAQDCLLEFPKSLKDYILENLDFFIQSDDLEQTYSNIVEFVESGTYVFMHELCAKLRGENIED